MEIDHSDELYSRIKTVTQSMIDGVTSKIDHANPAFIIYSRFNKTIQETPSLTQLFDNHPDLKTGIIDLLSVVETDPEYMSKEGIDKKKRGWNILGDQLVTQLNPRFCKQKPYDPTRDRFEQTVEWMQSNESLNVDTDQNTVVIGFLAIHFVK